MTGALVSPAELLLEAREYLEHAYAPYSDFQVACTVVDEKGRHFSGVNVENASYGLTICAERAAIFAAVAAGGKKIHALAVTAAKLPGVTPCGACRQVMVEFCDPSTPVYSDTGSGNYMEWSVSELLPNAFTEAGFEARLDGYGKKP